MAIISLAVIFQTICTLVKDSHYLFYVYYTRSKTIKIFFFFNIKIHTHTHTNINYKRSVIEKKKKIPLYVFLKNGRFRVKITPRRTLSENIIKTIINIFQNRNYTIYSAVYPGFFDGEVC